MNLVVEDGHHELSVVTQHRTLASVERAGFRPAQTDADAESADFRGFVDAARIAGHIQTWDADGAAGTTDLLERVQHGSRLLLRSVLTVAVSLKADTVHRRVHHRLVQNLLYLLGQRGILAEIDDFATEAPCLRETLRNHIAHNHDSCTQ